MFKPDLGGVVGAPFRGEGQPRPAPGLAGGAVFFRLTNGEPGRGNGS